MKLLKNLIARFKARRELNRKLENLTDYHFLFVAGAVSKFEADNPGTIVNEQGINLLRSTLES